MKKLIGVAAVTALVVACFAPLNAQASTTFRSGEPTVSAEEPIGPDLAQCKREAFGFARGGFSPVPPGSRNRIVVVLGFLAAECPPRQARAAIFDRKAGSKLVIQASRWTDWTTERRFVRFLPTRRYRCGHYRSVYVQVAYSGIVRTFVRKGVRAC